jgi:hypothetical protein
MTRRGCDASVASLELGDQVSQAVVRQARLELGTQRGIRAGGVEG